MASEEFESREMARWRGSVDANLAEHMRRLDQINGDLSVAARAAEDIRTQISGVKAELLEEIGNLRTDTRVELTALRVKVALGATIGGLIGAGVVSLLIALVTGALGGNG
jgi:hypothetical protein